MQVLLAAALFGSLAGSEGRCVRLDGESATAERGAVGRGWSGTAASIAWPLVARGPEPLRASPGRWSRVARARCENRLAAGRAWSGTVARIACPPQQQISGGTEDVQQERRETLHDAVSEQPRFTKKWQASAAHRTSRCRKYHPAAH